MATTLLGGKAKAIDTLITGKGGAGNAGKYGHENAAVPDSENWPEAPQEKQANQKEEDMYGYRDAAPTPRTNVASNSVVSRRSSLKSGGRRRASISYSGEISIRLPTGEITRKRTSVSFKDDADVKDIEPVADMVDNPRRLWFQEEEYSHIRSKIDAVIARAKNGEQESTTSWLCTRGLETLMGRGIGYYERKEAYECVLEEQEMQKARGKYDDEHLRTMYSFHTVDAQVLASERAENDAKEVEQYLKITRKMCRRLSC
jgi:hypothetical protein